MREIKFRGKRVDNGEWVHGSLQILANCDKGEWVEICGYEVDVETVGEFTGLRDKNNCRIYEGDILAKPSDWLNGVKQTDYTQVIWHNGGFYLLEQNDSYHPIDTYYIQRMTVIGNIHDNPNLKIDKDETDTI